MILLQVDIELQHLLDLLNIGTIDGQHQSFAHKRIVDLVDLTFETYQAALPSFGSVPDNVFDQLIGEHRLFKQHHFQAFHGGNQHRERCADHYSAGRASHHDQRRSYLQYVADVTFLEFQTAQNPAKRQHQ